MIDNGGPALFFSAEETTDEIHRRAAEIVEHHGIGFADIADVHVHCRPGDDALLAVPEKGIIKPTPLFAQLMTEACDRRAAIVIIEAAADVFGGDENDRGEVRQFMALMRQLAMKSDAAVLLLQHPSQSGMATGSGTAGSTQWNNTARSRLYFSGAKTHEGDEPDRGLRELRVMKSNYGPAGEIVRVRWERGVFVPDSGGSSIERAAAEQPIDDAFMRCLDAATAQGRTVSDKAGRNYAPAIFAQMPEAKGIKNRAFELAMPRLFSRNVIKVQTVGTKSNPKSQLVRVTQNGKD
jgi:RecA-family ATPase